VAKKISNGLIQECIAVRLTYRESEAHIKEFTGEEISEAWWYRKKSTLMNDKSLNKYFDEQLRIGFMRDYRIRKIELESVLDKLMHRWYSLVDTHEGEPEPNIMNMRLLSNSINEISRTLREISLDNPIIAGIKAKIEEHDKPIQAGETSTIDITQGTAFS